MTQPSPSAPRLWTAALGAVLFGPGMVAANALVQVGGSGETPGTGTSAPGLRLAAVATAAAGLGVLLLLAAAAHVGRPTSRLVTTSAGGAAASALFLLAGLRYAVPEPGALASASPVLAAATTACAFAAFVSLGLGAAISPGPPGAVRWLGWAAGTCCAGGPLLASILALADEGAAHGLAVASTALGVLVVTAWGVGLTLVLRRAQPTP